jgi:hypothetical protein
MVKGVKKQTKIKKLINGFGKLSAGRQIIIVIIILALGFVAYQQIMRFNEKRALLDKYQKLDEVAQKIESQYPPTSKTSERYCRHQSRKFEEGPTYCVYSIDLSYNVKNINEANQKKDEISNIFSNAELKGLNGKKNFDEDESITISGSIGQDLSTYGMSRCFIGYRYSSEFGNNIFVSVGCSDFTKHEYFPVRK